MSGCFILENSPNHRGFVENSLRSTRSDSRILPHVPGMEAWILLYPPEAILGQGRGLEGYFHELKPRRWHSGFGGPKDQHPMGRRVVQLWPGHLELVQLAQAVRAKGVDSASIAYLGRVHSELTVETRPGKAEWTPSA